MKCARIHSKNHETTSMSMLTSQFDQINHHAIGFSPKNLEPTIYLHHDLTTIISSSSNYVPHQTYTNLFQKSETTSTSMSTSEFYQTFMKKYPSSKVIMYIFLSQGVSSGASQIFPFWILQNPNRVVIRYILKCCCGKGLTIQLIQVITKNISVCRSTDLPT